MLALGAGLHTCPDAILEKPSSRWGYSLIFHDARQAPVVAVLRLFKVSGCMPFVYAMQSMKCTVLAFRFPLSKWALLLNELTPELHAKLPPTDDRLRPDMRLFEHGFFHEVSSCGPV